MAYDKNTVLSDALKTAGYQSEGGEVSRRGPGRPPKTTAGVNNTADTYVPTVERNNADQALQPTGEGSIATLGGSDVHDGPESGKPAGKPASEPEAKYFPVTLKRNYRPLGDTNWRIITIDGDQRMPPDIDDGSSPKAPAGSKIALPIEEAKDIIKRGIAERADEIA